MRFFSVVAAIGVLVAVGAAPGLADGLGEARAGGSGWYLGVGVGPGGGATLEQEGWNRDAFCYPDNACYDVDPIPSVSGYRWNYDIDLDGGAAFELSVGRRFGRAWLELSFAQQRNGVSQNFTGIQFYDGSPLAPSASATVNSNARASIDALKVRSLTVNGYYDFPVSWGGFSPYLGVGAGLARVEVAGLHYSADYKDSSGGLHYPPLSTYNSVQNADLDGELFTWALHAGADYSLSDEVVLGLKFTLSNTSELEREGRYETHAMHALDPDFTNTNRFSGTRNWALRLTMKRFLGR